jgi:pimeloyl-ACP methyl ester carboxylesterase
VTPSIIDLAGGPVEYCLVPGEGPVVVFLHEGLGSMRLWRDLPARLAPGRPILVWSRHGYGQSSVVPPPRPVSYMHHEALDVLPELLESLRLEEAALVGHSDGASIALIHASGRSSIRGVVAIAPHVLVEDRTVEAIEAAREAYLRGELRSKLARHHNDVDATFWGWNGVWLNPAFQEWNIEEYLPAVACPLLAVQSEDDPYGSVEQLERISRSAGGPVASLVLGSGGHAPHISHPETVMPAVEAFLAAVLGPV